MLRGITKTTEKCFPIRAGGRQMQNTSFLFVLEKGEMVTRCCFLFNSYFHRTHCLTETYLDTKNTSTDMTLSPRYCSNRNNPFGNQWKVGTNHPNRPAGAHVVVVGVPAKEVRILPVLQDILLSAEVRVIVTDPSSALDTDRVYAVHETSILEVIAVPSDL